MCNIMTVEYFLTKFLEYFFSIKFRDSYFRIIEPSKIKRIISIKTTRSVSRTNTDPAGFKANHWKTQ